MSIIDLAVVRRLYIDEQYSIRSIAAILHVNPRTVHDAMMRGRIPRRQSWEKRASMAAQRAAPGKLDESILRRLYVIEIRSLHEIADILGTSATTVRQALVYWNIPRRRRGRPRTRSELRVPCAEQE
jgi:DNA-directed RNA polymerase specialized sigma24 family protein